MVTRLYEEDPRSQNLYDALWNEITERGTGMEYLTILGVLELLKSQLIDEME